MEEKELKINDKIYVLKEAFKERNIGIMDAANVSMIFKLDEDWLKEDILELPDPNLIMKENGELSECTIDFEQTKILTKEGTKIGYDMYKLACKMVNALTFTKNINKKVPFKVYEGWDKDTKKFKKDYPIVLEYNGYGSIIAPRVEND